MFIDDLLNKSGTPVLEQVLQFTAARHKLIAENVANIDVPGYLQKDLDIHRFQKMLSSAVEDGHPGMAVDDFDRITNDVQNPTNSILFHDGNNRSIEQLASDQAKNALMHNLVIELLRNQYQQMNMALSEKVS
jgi:flagellar basal-body rod protein FlgB